jgi:hypothetical protein
MKCKNPERNVSWMVSETAEATCILGASACMEGIMTLQ